MEEPNQMPNRVVIGTPDTEKTASKLRGVNVATALEADTRESREREAAIRVRELQTVRAEARWLLCDELKELQSGLQREVDAVIQQLTHSAAAEAEVTSAQAKHAARPPTPAAGNAPSLDDLMAGVIRGVGNRRLATPSPVATPPASTSRPSTPTLEAAKVGPNRPTGQVSFKTTQGDLVSSGYLHINGVHITQGDLMVLVNPVSGNGSAKGVRPTQKVASTLSVHKPLRLEQLQNALNLSRRVQAAVPGLRGYAEAALEVVDGQEGGDSLTERLGMLAHRLDGVGENLRVCLETLVHNESLTFPVADTSQHFEPPLPRDVAVKYYIFNKQLIFELYVVKKTSYAAVRPDSPVFSKNERPRSESRVVGVSFEFLDGSVEVLHHLRVSVPVPLLLSIVEHLSRAQSLLGEFLFKVECIMSLIQ